MQKLLITLSGLMLILASCTPEKKTVKSDIGPITLAIHGGAGTITRLAMSPEREAAYRARLEEALDAGYAVLENGGEATAAVIAAIQVMEESPLFNAGVGAVFTHDGKNELDASIMRGQDLAAGAVAGVSHIKSPIEAAHSVLTSSKHVMMAGKGAEIFAEEQGLEMVTPEYFFTQRRYNQLKRLLGEDSLKLQLDHDAYEQVMMDVKNKKLGTVGAVALDSQGNLAAGTSTGGMTNKKYGRVGDAPIIGAGTYADNHSCAVSATGHGEYFIRAAVAHDIAARMRYGGLSLVEAGDQVIHQKLVEMKGSGGVISLDRSGNVHMPFNSEGMYRGVRTKGKPVFTAIYKDEKYR